MSRNLTVYFSLISPWAYIGHGELQRIVARRGLRVDYRPVALSRLFPESGGLPLGQRHESRQNYRMVELQRWRDRRGLDFALRPAFWPFDPTAADQIVCALAAAGADAEPFIAAAFRAVFEQQRDLANAEVLRSLLQDNGLDPSWLARGAAAEPLYRENLAQALEAGVFGSPSYVLDGEIFWGQDRLDLLDDALASGRAPFTAKV